ncbi:MAG: hypothetical protein AAF327_25555 [Cyanobacteria bacterium P01_A01_bin.37]
MSLKLPPDPTPEQFEQAEPLIVKYIIESQYLDGILPLTKADGDPQENQYTVTAPGAYAGQFTDSDGAARFEFEFDDEGVSYSPINPEAIADEEE